MAAAHAPARAQFNILAKPVGPLCNLECEYCFYLPKRELFPGTRRFRMGDDALEAFTRQYIECQPAGTEEITFGWQGGEPTLIGLRFFRRAVELQRQHARPGMRIANAFQTNGTLLDDEWGRFLREHDFLVGLSLDGPRDLHDAYRRDGRDRGTFDRALRGLEVLKRHGVEFNTLTVVHRESGSHPERVYAFLEEIGSRFFQFIPLVEPGARRGTRGRSVGPEQYGRFLCGIFDRWLERGHVGRIFVRDFDATLALVAGWPASLCVHAETCGRSAIVEHNGDVFGCDHFADEDHRLGNVLEETLGEMIDSERQVSFGADKRDGLPQLCRECRYLRLCRGGCPKDRSAAGPDEPGGEGGVNYLCAGYQLFFEHSLPVFRSMARCLELGRPASDFDSMAGSGTRVLVPRSGAFREPGRNDPCSCGSGRKYKKCCLLR